MEIRPMERLIQFELQAQLDEACRRHRLEAGRSPVAQLGAIVAALDEALDEIDRVRRERGPERLEGE